MANQFNADYRGIGELLKSPEMQAAMHAKAERVAEAARATAPVGDAITDKHPGEYRDGFEVSSGTNRTRAYGRVENNVGHAAAVEFGNGRTQPANRARKTINAHYTLTRALDVLAQD